MSLKPLRELIDRYTPTFGDAVVPASAASVSRLERAAGPLHADHREFLQWMGEGCPFMDSLELAYSPDAVREIYEDPDCDIAEGYTLVGVDTSGNGYDVCLRRADAAIATVNEFHVPGEDENVLAENGDLSGYLATRYVEETLVPSHPWSLAAGAVHASERAFEAMRSGIVEACENIGATDRRTFPGLSFHGGGGLVVGLYRRPGTRQVKLYVGALDRALFEGWRSLVFDRWKMLRLP